MKYTVLTLLIICCSVFANAQNKGKVTGKVIDAGDKTAVDYATVSLFKQGATAAFNGASTDDKGNFVIDHVPAGDYKLNIDFIGYQRKTIDHVIVTGGTVSLGTIELASAQKQLQTVHKD